MSGRYDRPDMEATTGIFQILAAVIAVGGAAKLVAPGAFAETLTALRVGGGLSASGERSCGHHSAARRDG